MSILESFISIIAKELLQENFYKQELEEVNALWTGNVVGYTGPLGMDTKAIHKAFWSGDKKKKNKAKTSSLKK